MNGRPPAFWFRFIRANRSNIGAALGNIMAAIIAHHITNIRPAYPRVHTAGTITLAMPGAPQPRAMSHVDMPVPAPSRIQIQAIVITATRVTTTTARSRRRMASRVVVSVAVIAYFAEFDDFVLVGTPVRLRREDARSVRDHASQTGCAWPNSACTRI